MPPARFGASASPTPCAISSIWIELALRIATRGSALARWQAEHVASLLGGAELVIVQTAGDRDKTTSLSELGGQGVFVKEVQHAVLEGRADLAVHSAKDLPSNPTLLTPGL